MPALPCLHDHQLVEDHYPFSCDSTIYGFLRVDAITDHLDLVANVTSV
jgi:hypothetical protein